MTFYQQKLLQLKSEIYSNQNQIDSIISVRNFIDRNYQNDINLEFLSHSKFISKFHLLRLFKRYYGVTPRQYLMDKRIDAAKNYLQGGTSVTETCFAVGFGSVSSFSTLFKSKTGKSPSHFKKEQFSISKSRSNY